MRLLSLLVVALVLVALPARATPLVTPTWVSEQGSSGDLVILDIRWRTSADGPHPFEAGHLPGAVKADYFNDGWRETLSDVPGMMPPPDRLEMRLSDWGVAEGLHVVIVHAGQDGMDFAAAARAYWTLKVLGHESVSILDGGVKAWEAQGLPLSQDPSEPLPDFFEVRLQSQWIADGGAVQDSLEGSRATALLDGRTLGEFEGVAAPQGITAPKDRWGHLPGALHHDLMAAVDPETGKLLPVDSLRQQLAHVPLDSPVITYCNTGHYSAAHWFILREVLGHPDVAVYDASLAGWQGDIVQQALLATH